MRRKLRTLHEGALAHLGITQWCSLLGHRCDGVDGTCRCDCHSTGHAEPSTEA